MLQHPQEVSLMPKVLRFQRNRRKKSASCGRKLTSLHSRSRSSSRRGLPDTTVVANVLQRLALVNPYAVVMLVNLGRRMLAESELFITYGQ